MGSSIALHALLGAWLLYVPVRSPIDFPAQQMITVTLVAASPVESHKPSDVAPAENAPRQAEKQERKIPVIKKENGVKPEPVAAADRAVPVEAAMAEPVSVAETAQAHNQQVVTTVPLFDAAYLRNPAPEYPAQARRRRMEGDVMLEVLVTAEGAAQSVQITRSSGYALLDESARRTVQRWKFIPARQGGQAVTAHVIVPIAFRLE